MPALVHIRTYTSRLEAEIAVGVLEAHGIKAMVSADDMSGWRPELTFVLGARLLVKQENAEEAIKVLDGVEESDDGSIAEFR